ncbi:MAG: methionyl-tRNA formyltransferase [Firmicutes bacterium]|nr:methionyl-tRNA formyltransferase [Bacillota bacterium]
MGTPDFAVPTLLRLLQDGHEVCGVFTQPDKAKGRSSTLQPPPVKAAAVEHGIPVFQPQSMKTQETLELLQQLAPELIIVVAYGKILPKSVLELPQHGCINVHASLLPKYRGAAPIQWSIINGETVTGVTTMCMDVGVDTGDMLLKAETPIGENETAEQLHDRLSQMGAQLCSETITLLQQGKLVRSRQDDAGSCYAPMLTRELSPVDWTKPAQQIHNQVRGLTPWPGAETRFAGKRLKIHASRLAADRAGKPGEILSELPLVVACGEGTALELTEIQYEGGKRMQVSDFLRGHRMETGTLLG